MCEKTMEAHELVFPSQSSQAIGRSMWFKILKANSDFFDSVSIQVKTGRSLWFWHDWWIEKKTLKDKYPMLYKISRRENATVSCMKNGTWNLKECDLEDDEKMDMKVRIHRNLYILHYRDRRGLGVQQNSKNQACSSKGVVFDLGFIIRLYPIWSMLQSRGVQIQFILCGFCNPQMETVEHLFLHCSWESTVFLPLTGLVGLSKRY